MNEPKGGQYYQTPKSWNEASKIDPDKIMKKELKRLLSQAWALKLKTMFIYEPDAIQIIINNQNIQN